MSKRKTAANIENNKKRPKIHTEVSVSDINVPTTMFDKNLKFLSPLIQFMLNSTECKSSICKGGQKMGNRKVFHYTDIPQEMNIVLDVVFDQEDCHCFGMYDSSVTVENYDFCI